MKNVQDRGAAVADPQEEQELDELLGGGADAGDQDDAEAGEDPNGDPEAGDEGDDSGLDGGPDASGDSRDDAEIDELLQAEESDDSDGAGDDLADC